VTLRDRSDAAHGIDRRGRGGADRGDDGAGLHPGGKILAHRRLERIGPHGEVIVPLDDASVERACDVFAQHGVEALAICFLFSFLNPAHERRAAAIVERLLPGVHLSQSNLVSPEYREYERASTTVMNSYLAPVMTSYLDRLKTRVDEVLNEARLFIIQANGGATTVEIARNRAVATVNSGPAGGVVAAAWYGREHGREDQDRRAVASHPSRGRGKGFHFKSSSIARCNSREACAQ